MCSYYYPQFLKQHKYMLVMGGFKLTFILCVCAYMCVCVCVLVRHPSWLNRYFYKESQVKIIPKRFDVFGWGHARTVVPYRGKRDELIENLYVLPFIYFVKYTLLTFILRIVLKSALSTNTIWRFSVICRIRLCF